jgi:DNA-binding transcriptional regulator GbsR (MarR family)
VTNVTRETGNKRKHGGVPALNFEKYWHREIEALKADYKKVMASHPEAKKAMEKAYEVLTDIANLAGCTPKEVGESTEWTSIV